MCVGIDHCSTSGRWSHRSRHPRHKRGAADPDVLAIAISHEAVLLTQDKDFGELVFRLKMTHCGIVLIRLAGTAVPERAELVSNVIANHQSELLRAFTVICSNNVRIRPSETQS